MVLLKLIVWPWNTNGQTHKVMHNLLKHALKFIPYTYMHVSLPDSYFLAHLTDPHFVHLEGERVLK